jgi:hypothetical protein
VTSLDPKIIMREKGIETAKPIHPASWFRDTRLQIYCRRHVLERMTGHQEVRSRRIATVEWPGAIAGAQPSKNRT